MRSRRPGDDGATSWPEDRRRSRALVVSRPRRVRREPYDLTDGELAGRVYRLAGCAGSRVDPDDWFPVTRDVAKARDQAAHAIAVCARCARIAWNSRCGTRSASARTECSPPGSSAPSPPGRSWPLSEPGEWALDGLAERERVLSARTRAAAAAIGLGRAACALAGGAGPAGVAWAGAAALRAGRIGPVELGVLVFLALASPPYSRACPTRSAACPSAGRP